MLGNYIKIAWRNLIRNKSYSLINTIGLSIGIASCLLIFLFIQDELSYDRYHEKSDRIYRVYEHFERGGESSDLLINSARLGPELANDFPEVENFVRISNKYREVLVENDQRKFYEKDFFFADSGIFDVFSFSLLQGNPETALEGSFKIVISRDMSDKYFGNENPLGKTITVRGLWGPEEYEITGILENVPSNSHFNINFLTSLETLFAIYPGNKEMIKGWGYGGFYTYITVNDGVAPTQLEDKIQSVVQDHYHERAAKYATLKLQPLADIHLYSDFEKEISPNSDVRYIYIFGCITVLILIIAGVNYMNLATARSAERAMEVGIRKTLGVRRLRLIVQFLSESIFFCFISVLIALLLVEGLLPYFNNVTGKTLVLPMAEPFFYTVLIAILALIGLLAGLYPALVLSAFNPNRVFKGAAGGRQKSALRNALIVFQFAMTVFLIVSTLVIHRQLDHVRNKRLGLNGELVISLSADSDFRKSFRAFKDKLNGYAGIESISRMNRSMPTRGEMDLGIAPEGLEERNVNTYSIGKDFIETLEISLKAGTGIDEFSSDSNSNDMPVLINEAAAREWGWEEPVGKTLDGLSKNMRVLGVMEDFHYRSLKEKISPLVLWPSSYGGSQVLIRIEGNDVPRSLSNIQEVWSEFRPGVPMVYNFLDDEYDSMYKAEDRLASLFGGFSLLAIIIACLGLLGLAAYTAERRTKEIGIRKVFGATVSNIVGLLSRDFLLLVAVGFIISIPVAWYAMNRWLADFAYRIEMGAGIFLLAGAAAVLLALATVSWQSIRAALANPADSLRSE